RLYRARVELRAALLSRLLRVPVRHVVHGVGGARRESEGRRPERARPLPAVPERRRLEVPDRPAARRRRGHDHRRAARSHHQDDEPRDGRDGDDPREAPGHRPVAGIYEPKNRITPAPLRRPLFVCFASARRIDGSGEMVVRPYCRPSSPKMPKCFATPYCAPIEPETVWLVVVVSVGAGTGIDTGSARSFDVAECEYA